MFYFLDRVEIYMYYTQSLRTLGDLMRLPKGTLTKLAEITGIHHRVLSDYVSTRIRPGSHRALLLELSCKKIGLDVSLRLWIFGTSDELKAALTNNHIEPPITPKNNNGFWDKLSNFFLRT